MQRQWLRSLDAWILGCSVLLAIAAQRAAHAQEPPPSLWRSVGFEHPGLIVDLKVGLWAWPLPMDWDRDGDLDLLVSCPDVPSNGLYFFENPGGSTTPVFLAPKRLAAGKFNVTPSVVANEVRVLGPGVEYREFRKALWSDPLPLVHAPLMPLDGLRADQWSLVDYDGDQVLDLVIGRGDWSEYGWDDAFDAEGRWTRGPLHGRVSWLRGQVVAGALQFGFPTPIATLDGAAIDVYGMPSPNCADFDGDGDLDLLCGEFLDGFTYFRNVGTRSAPSYAAGRRLSVHMDLQMIVPVAIDWDHDGDMDLIVGDEDGRVAWIEHRGVASDGVPDFADPRYLQVVADRLEFGALATPCACDWDGDGDQDLIAGNTAGYIGCIENLGGVPPRWAAPRALQAAGETIRIQAGVNMSIQGPCEAKWGYTVPSVADWDGDGRLDLVANSITGRVVWWRNIGTRTAPVLDAPRSIAVAWPRQTPKPTWNWWTPTDGELVTQWRTTPVLHDWNADGLIDLCMLDPDGTLSWYRRQNSEEERLLTPPEHVFLDQLGLPLRLNKKRAGLSGRRKLCFTDWDGDGLVDIVANGKNAVWWKQLHREGERAWFADMGGFSDQPLAGHTTAPTRIDLDGDGEEELLLGAEDGRFYALKHSEWVATSLVSSLQSEMEAMVERGAPSVQVAFVRDGRVQPTLAAGYSNRLQGAKASAETIYGVGSTFKALTAATVMSLVDQGLIDLDADCLKHLPEGIDASAAEGATVSFRHLLGHVSGLPNGAWITPVWDRIATKELKELGRDVKFATPPLKQFVYSNLGYGLVGGAVERITEREFEKVVYEHLLNPLGLEHLKQPFRLDGARQERLAMPYELDRKGAPYPVRSIRYDVFPAGDAYLSAGEMAQFLAMLLNEGEATHADGTVRRVLSRDAVRAMQTPVLPGYGLGLALGELDGQKFFEHTGRVPGFQAYLGGDPAQHCGVYALSNGADLVELGRFALRLLRDPAFLPARRLPIVDLDASAWASSEGAYELSGGRSVQLGRGLGGPTIQIARQSAFTMRFVTPYLLRCIDLEASIELRVDENGATNGFVLHQAGTSLEGLRK